MREIKPVNNNGSIQLKFSFGGKRYSFNPVPRGNYKDKRDLGTAKAIATKIQNDILAGHFDKTLERYRLAPKTPSIPKPETLLELWDSWVYSLDLSPATQANHYRWVRQMIAKANPGLTDTNWLTQANISPRTYKDRLSLLRTCGSWAVTKGWLESNPYESLKPKKDSPKEIKPFTQEEIRIILDGFEYLYPHYVPFVSFLFATGVRTAEAIGLCWHHIDFERNLITISESMPKDATGNGYTRKRKETKTCNIRHLPLSPGLRSLLIALRPPTVNPDTLVFTSSQGYTIDADNFRIRQWTNVLKAKGIPYRKPYTTRHTMISHAIEQGIPLTGVAYLAGHKDISMVVKTYAHMINRPDLPDIL